MLRTLLPLALTALLAVSGQAQAVFLILDEDAIDNGSPPNFFSGAQINSDVAALGMRAQLRFFRENAGRTVTLFSGQIGDEGWFALRFPPRAWEAAGGLAGYLGDPRFRPNDPLPHGTGPGLGAPDRNGDREALLDKIPDVTPLRASALDMLRGRDVCALVYDGDIGINYSPLNASLKGATLGLVAFRVGRVGPIAGTSPSTLPAVEVTIQDAAQACASRALFWDAPVPLSSSDPVILDSDGVLNGASFTPIGRAGQGSAPGSIVSIFGGGFASQNFAAAAGPLPASLGGVSVTINGVPARLYFVGPRQINAQLPWGVLPAESATGFADIVVNRDGVTSSVRGVQLSRFSPGIFTFQSGAGPAVAVNSDGSIAQANGSIPGVRSVPARAGSTIAILATGLGPVDSPIEAGHNSLDRLRRTTTLPTVLIGGREAVVSFSGLSPEFAGVYQLNVEVPSGLSGDAVPLQIRLGGITTTDRVTIAVRQ